MSNEPAIAIRDLELPSDGAALQRVWREIGWSDSARTDRAMLEFYSEGSAGVGTINGEVECAVLIQPGTMRLDATDLPLCVVSAVTTKVKGVTLTNYSDLELEAVPREWRGLYNRIWDVTDFVVPSQENNALRLLTSGGGVRGAPCRL